MVASHSLSISLYYHQLIFRLSYAWFTIIAIIDRTFLLNLNVLKYFIHSIESSQPPSEGGGVFSPTLQKIEPSYREILLQEYPLSGWKPGVKSRQAPDLVLFLSHQHYQPRFSGSIAIFVWNSRVSYVHPLPPDHLPTILFYFMEITPALIGASWVKQYSREAWEEKISQSVAAKWKQKPHLPSAVRGERNHFRKTR